MVSGSVSQSFHFFWSSANSMFLRLAVSLCVSVCCLPAQQPYVVCIRDTRISSPPRWHPGRPQLHTTADSTP